MGKHQQQVSMEKHQQQDSNKEENRDANHVTLHIDSIYQKLNIVKNPENREVKNEHTDTR